ncbi:MAG: STAS domain-containing protein [Planctomycetes bacterium]|nr:STAS domain-containing protein [Planctomycetota bacterium]
MQLQSTEDVIRFRPVGKVVVASFAKGGFRDERDILKVLEKLAEFIEKRQGVRLLFNMEMIEYLSSAGLGALVGLLKKSKRQGGAFKLCSLQPPILELFEVMKLTKIFEIHVDEAEALQTF